MIEQLIKGLREVIRDAEKMVRDAIAEEPDPPAEAVEKLQLLESAGKALDDAAAGLQLGTAEGKAKARKGLTEAKDIMSRI